MGHLEELLPIQERLPGPTQRLPIIWDAGDSALSRFAAIKWRTREFFSGPVGGLISPFQLVLRAPCVDENELISHSATIAEWYGSSIEHELIQAMDNMSALSLLA